MPGPRLHEDVEGGAEPYLLLLQLGHALVLCRGQRQRVELGEDAANGVELLGELGKLFAQLVLLAVPVKVRPDDGKPQRHLREVPLLHLLRVHLVLHRGGHAADAHDREHRAQEHDAHQRPEAQLLRRAERHVHRPALRGIDSRRRSKTSPVRYIAWDHSGCGVSYAMA